MFIFDDFFPFFPTISRSAFGDVFSSFSIPFNVSTSTTQSHYIIHANVDGIPLSDISVKVNDVGTLLMVTLRGRPLEDIKEEESDEVKEVDYQSEKEDSRVPENHYEKYVLSVRFPMDSIDVDGIRAELKDGELLEIRTTYITDFRNPQILLDSGLSKSVRTVLENFKKCTNDGINDANIHKIVNGILEQANDFQSLTQDSVNHCSLMASYATDFIEYIQILMEEDVLCADFIEAMKSQLQSATSNRLGATRLAQGYCEVLTSLKKIATELEEYTSLRGIEKKLEQDAENLKKEQKANTWAAVGTGITTGAAIVAAPFTGGASLAVVGALGLTSAGAMIGTSVNSVKFGERAKLSENELQQISEIRVNVGILTTELLTIIDKFSEFDEFFRLEIQDITNVTEKYAVDGENQILPTVVPTPSVTQQTLNITEFNIPQIPSTEGLFQDIASVLDNFEEFSKEEKVEDTNIHAITILEQDRKFMSLIKDSIDYCVQMAVYATDFMEYVQILMEEEVLASDFIETMRHQAQTATKNRLNATSLVERCCDMLIALQNIVNEMEDFASQTGIEKELEQHVGQARKGQKVRTFAAVGTGITTGVAIIAAPFTGGLSLAIIGALGLTSAGAMIGTSVTSVRYGELAKVSESELRQINQIRTNIRNVIRGLRSMVEKFHGFDKIFRQEVEDITKAMENYGTDDNEVGLRMSRMKGTAIRNQWSRVKCTFETYANETHLLLGDYI
ncbi:6585_t:CDS:2 [Acaulospora colombiana]|uniref:6585_t:CDS:1 n=1 Tax=Acaulospora colombiana TaxID=27376 RepID=A0ACA9LJB8_9GLOM|nr:6585_t:CDS:2 [Acaulospora colombiana]